MTGRYVEVNMDETNEIMRMSCPACKYPMRVLGKHEDNIYHCYCAACQTDRYMKDTLDTEKLTFKEFDRGMKRGKGIDLEQISDLVYELYDENEQLKQASTELKEIGDYQADRIQELDTENQQLINENEELKKENKRLKRLTASPVIVDANVIAETIATCRGITVEEYLKEIEEEYTKGDKKQ